MGHSNRNHATSTKRGRLERLATKFSKPDLYKLLNKALQAPSLGGGCVIPITVPYTHKYFRYDLPGQKISRAVKKSFTKNVPFLKQFKHPQKHGF